MPTGYTCIIEDGEATFEQYVWRCARAFGALIELRDDPVNSSIPDAFTPSQWNANSATQQRARLKELEAMTPEQADRKVREEYEAAVEERRKSTERYRGIRARYAAMRAKVADWHPPTLEHEGLKRFMIEQIDLCTRDGMGPYGDPPVLESGADWLEQAKGYALAAARRHDQSQREEEERVRGRNEWVSALRKSVPPPEEGR